MKAIYFALLVMLSVGAYAYPVDENGDRMITIPEKLRCQAKGDVTLFVYERRDEFTEEQAFEFLEKAWNATWSDVPSIQTATYVDMQRIIRDAYRTNGRGEFRQECCTEEIAEKQTMKVLKQCLLFGF